MRHATASLVIVGGATLALRGVVDRATTDVDVIARVAGAGDDSEPLPAEPFPDELRNAAARVARDYGLPAGWLNGDVGKQWRAGLPPELMDDLTWLGFGALQVGLVGRQTLVSLKLFAAVDQGTESLHWKDLLALEPSPDEWEAAAGWVRTQDTAPEFQIFLEQAIERVQRELEED